jgi:hypothetical protein
MPTKTYKKVENLLFDLNLVHVLLSDNSFSQFEAEVPFYRGSNPPQTMPSHIVFQRYFWNLHENV